MGAGWWRSCGADCVDEVGVEEGRGEEEGIDEVECATDTWEHGAGVFDACGAFDEGFGEVADNGDEAEEGAEGDGDAWGEEGEAFGEEGDEAPTAEGGEGEGSGEAFHGFFGGDVWDHRGFADERSGDVGAAVRELGRDAEEEEVVVACEGSVGVFRDDVENFPEEGEEEGCVEDAEDGEGDGVERVLDAELDGEAAEKDGEDGEGDEDDVEEEGSVLAVFSGEEEVGEDEDGSEGEGEAAVVREFRGVEGAEVFAGSDEGEDDEEGPEAGFVGGGHDGAGGEPESGGAG